MVDKQKAKAKPKGSKKHSGKEQPLTCTIKELVGLDEAELLKYIQNSRDAPKNMHGDGKYLPRVPEIGL